MPTIEEIKLALIAVAILGASVLTGHFVHQVDLAKLQKVELEYKQAQADAAAAAKAEQAQLDKVSSDADAAELAQQKQMLADTQTRLAQVSKRVTRGANNCITWDLVRAIDSAAFGVDSDSMPLPAGKTGASCAGVDPAQLAAGIVANYAVGSRNKAVADGLQAYVKQLSQVKR